MQAHNNTIEEFLGAPKTVFVVPVYQRNYDWREDNCKQLFNDIVHVVESGQEHFLGTICFKMYSSHERSIIDGQQRLTSITLMLKAIYDFDEENITEGNYKITYAVQGHEFKVHTTKNVEVGKKVDLQFAPEDIHVMSKMGF